MYILKLFVVRSASFDILCVGLQFIAQQSVSVLGRGQLLEGRLGRRGGLLLAAAYLLDLNGWFLRAVVELSATIT